YAQERKWFWTCFVAGAWSQRVCWQVFEETPTFDGLAHLATFAGEIEWWRFAPAAVVKTAEGVEAYGCTDGQGSAVVYVIGGGAGHAVTLDLSLIGAAQLTETRIRRYAPTTGRWRDDLAFSLPARSAGRVALPPLDEDLALLVQPVA